MRAVSALTTQRKENTTIAVLLLFLFFLLIFFAVYLFFEFRIWYAIWNYDTLPAFEKRAIEHKIDIKNIDEMYSFFSSKSYPNPILICSSLAVMFLFWVLSGVHQHIEIINTVSGARGITRFEEPKLYNILENLCISVGEEAPSLQIIEISSLNAFASGLSTEKSSITVTRGLINALSAREMEAVLAHELSHIRNADIRVKFVSVIIIGHILFLIRDLFWLLTGLQIGKSTSISKLRLTIGVLVFYFFWDKLLFFVFPCVIPWVVFEVVDSYFSRESEYIADMGAIDLIKDPDILKSAMQKIHTQKKASFDIPKNILKMCIDNPDQATFSFLSSHPRMEDRFDNIDDYSRELKLR